MPKNPWVIVDDTDTQPQEESTLGSIARNTTRTALRAGQAALAPADILQGLGGIETKNPLPESEPHNKWDQTRKPLPNPAGLKRPKTSEERSAKASELGQKLGTTHTTRKLTQQERQNNLWTGLPSQALEHAAEKKLPKGWTKTQGSFEHGIDAVAKFIPAAAKAYMTGGISAAADVGKIAGFAAISGELGDRIGGEGGRWIGEITAPIVYGFAKLGKHTIQKIGENPKTSIVRKAEEVEKKLYDKAIKDAKNLPADSSNTFKKVNSIVAESAPELSDIENTAFADKVGQMQNEYFTQTHKTIGGETIPSAQYYGEHARYPADTTMAKLVKAKQFANNEIAVTRDPAVKRAWRRISGAIGGEIQEQGASHPEFLETFNMADQLHGRLADAGEAQELINAAVQKAEPNGPLTRWRKNLFWGAVNQAGDLLPKEHDQQREIFIVIGIYQQFKVWYLNRLKMH